MMTEASWTWMVYLATHSDDVGVAESGEKHIKRMREAQRNDKVRVLVQQSTSKHTVRRIIGATPEIAKNLGGDVDSADPGTLRDFVQWARDTAPAQHYALVLWSHGSGWEPSEMERVARQGPPPPADGPATNPQEPPAVEPFTKGEVEARCLGDDKFQVFFSTTMRKLLAKPTAAERAVAFDDGSGHSLDTIELGQVAADAHQILGQRLDLLGMNACQMSNIEIAYQIRNHVHVYVASEENIPSARSFPYHKILTCLANEPDMNAVAVGQMIVTQYCDSFRKEKGGKALSWGENQHPKGITLTAVRPEKITPLVEAVKELRRALQTNIQEQLQAILDANCDAITFKYHLRDLGSFCDILSAHAKASSDSRAAAKKVRDALDEQTFVVMRDNVPAIYDGIGGLSTYLVFPQMDVDLSPHYVELAYAGDTGWGNFLKDYRAEAFRSLVAPCPK